jgi:D-alanyl-D-alanine carboxypeptidase/D-alanyl-D-alanine-endopeptidase (penicillin-binding protein 4)
MTGTPAVARPRRRGVVFGTAVSVLSVGVVLAAIPAVSQGDASETVAGPEPVTVTPRPRFPRAGVGAPDAPLASPARGREEAAPTDAPAVALTAGLAAPDPEVDALRRSIDAVLRGARWSRARWSVLAISLDRGDTLYARDAHEALTPASNVKLVTTAAALHYLGPDFRYPTYVLADGPTEAGVLQGDLVLYGTGDPALSDRFYPSETDVFRSLAAQLREAGIERIAGDLVGDGTYFRGPAVEATWDPTDLSEWFAAPVSALSFNENMIALRVEAAGWVGAPPRIQTLPAGAGVLIDNAARTVASVPDRSRRLAIVRESHGEPIRVVGEISLGSRDVWREITVSDPPHYAATIFRQVLEEEGIRVNGGVRSAGDPDDSVLVDRAVWGPGFESRTAPRVLAEHRSPPLSRILEVVNKQSHNLYAESVLRVLGATVVGDASFEGGVEATRRFLANAVRTHTGVFEQVDGSGLSAENRASASLFVEVLAYMADSELWDPFWETLPEAGNRRELPRMYRSSAAGNLRAKTGTIARVSALSGVVRSASGERIAFSILANDVPSTWRAKNLEDRIGIRLAEFRRSTADPVTPR